MITRRILLKSLAGGVLATSALGGYAFGLEPRFRLVETRYRVNTPRVRTLLEGAGKPIRIAALADLHACEPWMPVSRIDHIVQKTNALNPDLIVLLGDFVAGLGRFRTATVPMRAWSAALGRLEAPQGIFAVLGNHDWWVNAPAVTSHLQAAGIRVLENRTVPITIAGGARFWLAGLGDQLAIPNGRGWYRGVDDMPGTLAQIGDEQSPAILLAHEPDIFPEVPDRFDLTLSGHTHGGQVHLPYFGAPIVPSRYGQRFAYGHITENNRQLIVSGGLGCSILPVRFGVPPEITVIDLG
ncbi:metallophosphoesterase [Hoeflea sp. TYP-13]|uniref:metallophosphoesterase n=1 Tax=Hoeflea sp. TYP-13 TaxID=3230023 RepID=UPI0034C6C5CF